MKASELRIGNLVRNSLNETQLISTGEYIYNIERGMLHVKPLELTPEWLERMGFITDARPDHIKGQYGIAYNPMATWYDISWVMDRVIIQIEDNAIALPQDIKYVHQLQNLYFALTGQELTIKELVKI